MLKCTHASHRSDILYMSGKLACLIALMHLRNPVACPNTFVCHMRLTLLHGLFKLEHFDTLAHLIHLTPHIWEVQVDIL